MNDRMTDGLRAASFSSGSKKVTINPLNVTYLREVSDAKTQIFFADNHSVVVDSPIGIVEDDLFPNRRFASQ